MLTLLRHLYYTPKNGVAKERLEQVKSMMAEREEKMSGTMVERLVSGISSGELKYLKVVLKADTKGSLEAIMQALNKIRATDVHVKVIHFGVGNFSDTDVIMAAASQALLVGFHVDSSVHVKKLADREGVDIKDYEIIIENLPDDKIANFEAIAEKVIRRNVEALFIVKDEKKAQDIVRESQACGARLVSYYPRQESLEEYFISQIKEGDRQDREKQGVQI